MIELTNEEIEFLYSLLDQVNVSGMKQKFLLLGIMEKLAEVADEKTEKNQMQTNTMRHLYEN
jgi:hypothetical protein